jgi:hypothetical protein
VGCSPVSKSEEGDGIAVGPLAGVRAHLWVDAPLSSGSSAGLYLHARQLLIASDGDSLLCFFYPHEAVVATLGPSASMVAQILSAQSPMHQIVSRCGDVSFLVSSPPRWAQSSDILATPYCLCG